MLSRKEIIFSFMILASISLSLGVLRALISDEFYNETVKSIYIVVATIMIPCVAIFVICYISILKNRVLTSYFISSPKKLFFAIIIAVSLYGAADDIAELDPMGGIITVIIATAFAGAGAAVLARYFRKKVPKDPRGLS